MSKIRIPTRYGVAPNELLNNPEISLKAKGLFALLQSKPDGWSFSIERIAKQASEGKSAIRSAIKELEEHGYLARKAAKTDKGTWNGYEYTLFAEPLSDNRTTGNPTTENCDTLSKKDNSKQEIVNKKDNNSLATASVAGDIQKVIERFQTTVNPLIDYGNKTERKAAEDMIKAWGVEKVLNLIDYCNEIRTEEFAPNVTTPHELKRKYPKVLNFKEKNEPVKVPDIQTCPDCFVTPCVCR